MNVMDNSNYNLITYIQKLAYNALKQTSLITPKDK